MMGIGSMKQDTVGVDVGRDTLRAVALRSTGAGHIVLAAAETRRTPNHPCPIERDVQRLMYAMERQGFSIKNITLGAPPDRLACAVMELPPRSSGAPIDSLADAELAKSVPGSFESSMWDLPDAPRQSASEYFAVALSHTHAMDLISPFENEGIVVGTIEPEMTAIGRVTGGNNRLVLDIGRRGVRMYAFEGKKILFARNLPHSAESGISAGAFTGVVGTIDYLAGRFPCLEHATVVVLGKPSEYETIREQILREFEADITNTMPIDLTPAPCLTGVDFDAQWATAIGLALRPAHWGAA